MRKCTESTGKSALLKFKLLRYPDLEKNWSKIFSVRKWFSWTSQQDLPAIEQYLSILSATLRVVLKISKHTCNISCRWHIAGQNILTPSAKVWKKLGSILYSCQKGERYTLDISTKRLSLLSDKEHSNSSLIRVYLKAVCNSKFKTLFVQPCK